jgi:hypothetical protein
VKNVGGQTTGVIEDPVFSAPEFGVGLPDTCSVGSVTLAPGTSCSVDVRFTASATSGTANGQVSVSANPGGTATATLDGTMTPTPVTLSLTPASTTFVDQFPLDPEGQARDYTLTNNGGSATGLLTVSHTESGLGTWNVTGCDGQDLSLASSSCSLTIEYIADDQFGGGTLDLQISGATAGALQRTFTGTNERPLAVSPNPVNLVAPAIGQSSPDVVVTIVNNGSETATQLQADVDISTGDGVFFPTATTCSSTLAAGDSCTVSVEYFSQGSGSGTGFLSVQALGVTSVNIPLNGSTNT